MASNIKSIRGMHDILPEQSGSWAAFENTVKDILSSYGYKEIRMPIVESTELFKRSIGDVTDIVEKEMYTFDDRNGDSLTLRPEGTAGCVRACMQNGLLHNQQQRLWYQGPMFRHERPQKGRYRQFQQIGVETYGLSGPEIDAELIGMTARLWRRLGLNDVRLELNSLGSSDARAAYRGVLVEYFSGHFDLLDDDSKRRLESNPLRILDSKNPVLQQIIADAPSLLDHLDEESLTHFTTLRGYLDDLGIEYVVNPRLVRGLDYYGRTVFEWITESLGAQGTICAGGRYDGLVNQLGGKPTAAIGFAMGVERIIQLLEEQDKLPQADNVHAYISAMGDSALGKSLQIAEQLRDEIPTLRVLMNADGGGLKAQMKRADKSGAAVAIILGEDELASGSVGLKYLRDRNRDQDTVALAELASFLATELQIDIGC